MKTEAVDVVAAVIRSEDRLMICQRNLSKRHGGLWEFPGGKVLAGEAFHDALQREIFEELGVETSHVGELLYSARDEHSPFVIHFMEASIVGKPVPAEHHAIEWLQYRELLGRSLAPADRQFVQMYLSDNFKSMAGL